MPAPYTPLDNFGYTRGHQYGAQTMPMPTGGLLGATPPTPTVPGNPSMPGQPTPAYVAQQAADAAAEESRARARATNLATQTKNAAAWSNPNMQVPSWVTPEWQASHPLGVGKLSGETMGPLGPVEQFAFSSYTDRSPEDFAGLVKYFGSEQGAMDWLTPSNDPLKAVREQKQRSRFLGSIQGR